MPSRLRTFLTYIGAVGVVVAAIVVLVIAQQPSSTISSNPTADTAQVANASLPSEATPLETAPLSPPSPNTEQSIASVARTQDPYPFPQELFPVIHEKTRAALVNIFCATSGGSFQSTSGSGVIIDPRGIILTNAHVAQYVLLAQSSRTDLSCFVRYGAPAQALWEAEVLYIPPVWVGEHAADITNANPTGTGEHDYALLRITRSAGDLSAAPEPIRIPSLPFDTREAIAFPSDFVLAASYPSEFIGGTAPYFNLFPVSSIAPIGELLTFEARSVDLISLSGVAEAQSGSSGGPVVNAWGYLVGIITTTSEGATTADRELRAITLSYINRDLVTQAGLDISDILSGNVEARAAEFEAKQAPALVQALVDELSKRSR